MTNGPATNAPAFYDYLWNARNQLTGYNYTGITFSYDAEGQRTAMNDGGQTTTFITDPHGPLSRLLWREKAGYGRRYFIYAGGGLLYDIAELPGVVNYYHYDHLGNTIALTDSAGTVVGRTAYSAYGERIGGTGTLEQNNTGGIQLDTPFLWQGAYGVQTDHSGLIYMRARYYHPDEHRNSFNGAAPRGARNVREPCHGTESPR